MISVIVILLSLIVVRTVFLINDEMELLNREVTIEAGTVSPDLNMFFKEEPLFPSLVSSNLDFGEVNTNLPQTVNFNINMYGRNFACKLIIQDTVPPAGEAVLQKIFACEDIPDVMDCLTGIEDITDVTAVWKDVPDYSQGGSFMIGALLTDGCGNETLIEVPFEVTKDSTPPVITNE